MYLYIDEMNLSGTVPTQVTDQYGNYWFGCSRGDSLIGVSPDQDADVGWDPHWLAQTFDDVSNVTRRGFSFV
jgi:hypothetical protein